MGEDDIILTKEEWWSAWRALAKLKIWPMGFKGGPGSVLDQALCPKCNRLCPLYDCVEVDIGVGIQRGEESWMCPVHGEWTYANRWKRGEPIWRDDEE